MSPPVIIQFGEGPQGFFTPSETPSPVIEEFNAVAKHTLRGFVRVRFANGQVMAEVAIHVSANGRRAWAAPPALPLLDADGNTVRDQRTGKPVYRPLIKFTTPAGHRAWSESIIRAVRETYPEALRVAP